MVIRHTLFAPYMCALYCTPTPLQRSHSQPHSTKQHPQYRLPALKSCACPCRAGSPLYLSPEVWRDGSFTHKSDIWAIGCVAYELLAQQPPFLAPGLAHKVLNDIPPVLPSKYDTSLCVMIDGMLNKDPDVRPSTAQLLRAPCMAAHVDRWLQAAFTAV